MQAQPDEEYLEYVRARQGHLLRAAYLVRGDRRAAASLLEASLRSLARSWHRVRSEDPDGYLRRRLYREAVSSGRRDRDAPALLDLTPSQRALAALLLFEERTDAEAADALGWRVDKVRSQMERVLGRFRSAEALADRLRVLAEQLPEPEFAASSWAGARDDLRRRRRTTAVSVAGLAVFGLLASGLVGPSRSGREDAFPAPTAPATTEAGGFKRTFSDVAYVVSPEVGSESRLERLPSRLPEVVASPPRSPREWDWPPDRPLVAVVLTKLAVGRYAVALVGPDGGPVRVPGVTLEPTRGAGGATSAPLSATAVSPDGRAVVFPQPGRVAFLTVATGDVRSARVPGVRLQRAGWTRTGTNVVTGTDHESWLVEAGSLRVRRLTRAAPAGQFSIAGSGLPRPFVQTWDAEGEYVRGEGLPLRPELEGRGDTVGSDLGWAGRAVSLVPDIPSSSDGGRAGQGLVAVHAGDPDTVRLLLFGRSADRPQRCCRAVGWRDGVLIFTSRSGTGRVHLLGWDVASGEVLRVALVPGEAIALGPGL
jgi:hypothetical protein